MKDRRINVDRFKKDFVELLLDELLEDRRHYQTWKGIFPYLYNMTVEEAEAEPEDEMNLPMYWSRNGGLPPRSMEERSKANLLSKRKCEEEEDGMIFKNKISKVPRQY